MSFYDDTAVNNAKKSLYDGLKNMDLGLDMINRVGSNNRSAKEAEVEDILDAFQKMDTASHQSKPVFYAEDLTSLPPAAPEEGSSMMTIFELLAKQQQEMKQMPGSMKTLDLEISKNEAVRFYILLRIYHGSR